MCLYDHSKNIYYIYSNSQCCFFSYYYIETTILINNMRSYDNYN